MKEKLITALKSERERLRNKNAIKHWDATILYLETGELPTTHIVDYELLDKVMTDFISVCSQYGITE